MAFTKFTIKNFKCFKDEQSLSFAIPSPSQIGSGITYIVGANNSGKTTIIEGLSIKKDSKIKSSERIENIEPEFVLFDSSGIKRRCVLVRPESYTIKEYPQLNQDELFEIISSRRHWQSAAPHKFSIVGQGINNSYDFLNRQNIVEVASELKTIEADSTKYQEFISLVQKVIPEFTKFAVGFEDNEYIEYVSGSGIRHKTELLGDGVITVVRILLQLYINTKNPLIIDEPELSLHPTAQKRLLKVIADYSKTRQIILSTHSPYFIDWQYLRNGAVLNRVVKKGDANSLIFTISDFSKYEPLIRAANWQQPYLLDEVAKEIFFSNDNILFLEGQEDVGLLRKENISEKINIFGYGVRGKDNFEFAMELAKDLGFSKVCCILDGGSSETAIKEKLSSKSLSYGYKIIQWGKEDIRDKELSQTKEKKGYFDKHGTKKSLPELDDFDRKLDEVNSYFNS